MTRSNRLVIFVGVLLAILAFVGIVILLNNKGPTTGGASPSTVTVLVAKVNIAIGDAVTPDKVEAQPVDSNAVVETHMSAVSEVSGQPALFAIPKGSQVTQEAIGLGRGPNRISAQLKAGEKAIAFQVDRVTGLDFLIQVGDHVDIVMAEQITVLQPTQDSAGKPANQQRFETVQGLEKVRTVKALSVLQNKRVLYVSQTRVTAAVSSTNATPTPSQTTAQQQAANQIENVIIVIAGTDQDAELIKFAQNDVSEVGPLTAVLRSTTDQDTETTTGVTIDKLVSQYGLAIPGIVQQLQGP